MKPAGTFHLGGLRALFGGQSPEPYVTLPPGIPIELLPLGLQTEGHAGGRPVAGGKLVVQPALAVGSVAYAPLAAGQGGEVHPGEREELRRLIAKTENG